MVEAGETAAVLTRPQHPYTQLLIDSVPWPDLERRWGERPLVSGSPSPDGSGCLFRARCPDAIPACAERQPPLIEVDADQVAACIRRGTGAERSMEWLAERQNGRPVSVREEVRA